MNPFYSFVVRKVGKDPHISPADVLAVCTVESDCDPCFDPKDQQYRANLLAAMAATKLPELLLLQALLINEGPLKGRIAKFRLEPGYWEWSKTQNLPSPTDRFLASCSFGVGQQMMRWVLPLETKKWPAVIENFKGSIDVQLSYLITNLRTLLINNNGSILKSYRAYNSGNPNSKDPVVIARALQVKSLKATIEQELAQG